MKLKTIGVMGSGRKSWSSIAEPLGVSLAQKGVHLLTGGGDGVMKSVSRGFTSVAEKKGFSIGCLPGRINDDGQYEPPRNYPNPYIEIVIQTPLGTYDAENPDVITRNFINVLSSDLIIALPGFGGTRNEISLSQKFNKPFILYGPSEEFEDLPETMQRTADLDQINAWLDQKLSKQDLTL